MRITASDVAARTRGTLAGADATADGLAFDSRTLLPGQAFVALSGERDGHDFLGAAVTAGAAFLIVSRGRSVPGVTCVEVDDTDTAVTVVGHMCRERLRESAPGRVIAVTGSAGKTSTKDFVLAVLRAHWPAAHGAHLSFNNDIGVPVTLANAPDGCPAVVVEMGMRGHGEISRLCEVARPDVGIVTVVGDAHGELVGGIDGVERAKSELPAALPKSGTAVLNIDDHRVAGMSRVTGASVMRYGTTEGADVRFAIVGVDANGCCTVDMHNAGETVRVTVPLPGAHMAANACAAVAAGVAVGVPFAVAARAVADISAAPGRMQWRETGGGIRILDDTYNANPSSMTAALHTLCSAAATHHVAVLGAMAEISDPTASHRAVWQDACDLGVDVIALETDLYGPRAMSVAEAVSAVAGLGEGTVVLVKGSRSSRTERVVTALLEL